MDGRKKKSQQNQLNRAMIKRIAYRTSMRETSVKKILKEFYNDVFEQMRDSEDDSYYIYGFGEFYTRDLRMHQHLPSQDETEAKKYFLPVARVVRFKPCKKFKDVVNCRQEIERNKVRKKKTATKVDVVIDERTKAQKDQDLENIINRIKRQEERGTRNGETEV